MKRLFPTLMIVAPLFFLQFCTASFTDNHVKSPTNNLSFSASKKPVVMELFTSQGCSSCPSADRLLGKYASDPSVIALSFHVDYWNHLGWKDPFSSTENSERQKMYATSLGNDGVYTPQLVINGEREVVGSDEAKIKSILAGVSKEVNVTDISISSATYSDREFTIKYNLKNVPAESNINAAVILKKAVTSIKAGENRGVTLTNYNVVRSFDSIKYMDGDNISTIKQPDGVDSKDIIIALIVQEKSGKILAAAKSSL